MFCYKDLIFGTNYKFIEVTGFEVTKKINEHAVLKLRGNISAEGAYDAAVETAPNTPFTIAYKKGGKEVPIFNGIITETQLSHRRGVYSLTVTAKSFSFLTDIVRKSRSFQNTESLYEEIYNTVIKKDYGGAFLDTVTKGLKQNRTIIQYNETDWEFLKRIASYNNGVLLPETLRDGVNIYIGVPMLETLEETRFTYRIGKNVKRFEKHQRNHGQTNDFNYVVFEVESPEVYNVGDSVIYNQINLAVSEANIRLEKGRLRNSYKLQKRGSFKQMEIKNEQIKGVSISGKIIAVEKTKLKLHLEIDKSQPIGDAHFYEYVMEGAAGFYIMPQVGDNAKLYIPDSNEDNAYVKVLNRLDGRQNSKTADPDTRYIFNK